MANKRVCAIKLRENNARRIYASVAVAVTVPNDDEDEDDAANDVSVS